MRIDHTQWKRFWKCLQFFFLSNIINNCRIIPDCYVLLYQKKFRLNERTGNLQRRISTDIRSTDHLKLWETVCHAGSWHCVYCHITFVEFKTFSFFSDWSWFFFLFFLPACLVGLWFGCVGFFFFPFSFLFITAVSKFQIIIHLKSLSWKLTQ